MQRLSPGVHRKTQRWPPKALRLGVEVPVQSRLFVNGALIELKHYPAPGASVAEAPGGRAAVLGGAEPGGHGVGNHQRSVLREPAPFWTALCGGGLRVGGAEANKLRRPEQSFDPPPGGSPGGRADGGPFK